jgi:hypothetical protein
MKKQTNSQRTVHKEVQLVSRESRHGDSDTITQLQEEIEHEAFIRDLGLNEKSNLGDFLDNLKGCQEDVAINLLGHMLDLAKIKGRQEALADELLFLNTLVEGFMKGEEDGTETPEIKLILKRKKLVEQKLKELENK